MRRPRFPNTFVIVAALVALAALATTVTPGAKPQTWQVFTALYNGFVKQSGIIVFILIVGGCFWTINAGKAIDEGIESFIRFISRLESRPVLRRIGVKPLSIALTMLMFSLFGGVFGMSEETIAFVIITVPLAISMGYDSITGIAMVYVAAHVGFSGAFLNPFSVGIAQEMAGVPLFSGLGYRLLCWTIFTSIAISAVLTYAAWVRRKPERSPMHRLDEHWRSRRTASETGVAERMDGNGPEGQTEKASQKDESARDGGKPAGLWLSYGAAAAATLLFALFFPTSTLKFGSGTLTLPYLLPVLGLLFALSGWAAARKGARRFVLVLLGFSILYLIVGVLAFDWYIAEISALFLALGILSGTAYGWSANKIADNFLDGAKDMLSAALIVGLASGIILILQDGNVLDPMLTSLSESLRGSDKLWALEGMYGIQTIINLFLTSASAKAAITIPVMGPYADLIEVSRQSMVLAFQFGDGITNMITPTSGVLMAALGAARIPYGKWLRTIWPFILILALVGAMLLAASPF